MFFVEKTAPDAPEKHQTSINANKPASRVRFISKAIKPVTGRKRFQCSLKCDRLQIQLSEKQITSMKTRMLRSNWTIEFLNQTVALKIVF